MNSHTALLNLRDSSVMLCPLLALIVIRAWLSAGGPATAAASPPEALAIAEVSAFTPVAPEEHETLYLARVQELASRAVPDIFPRQERAPIVPEYEQPPEPEQPEVEAQETTIPEPDVIVTSIMGGRTPMAIINGRAHKAGDPVDDGWLVVSISDGKVIIGHRSGITRVLRIDRTNP